MHILEDELWILVQISQKFVSLDPVGINSLRPSDAYMRQ